MGNVRSRAVFLTQEVPWPLDNGLKLRSFQILSALAMDYDTTVLSFSEYGGGQLRSDSLRANVPGIAEAFVVRHQVRLGHHPFRRLSAVLQSLLQRQPYSIIKFRSRDMDEKVDQLASQSRFQLAVSTLAMMPYALRLVRPDQVIYECQNIEFQLWESFLQGATFLTRFPISNEVQLLKVAEQEVWKRSGMVITLCNEDASIVQSVREMEGVAVIPTTIARIRPGNEPILQEPPQQVGCVADGWKGGTIGLIGSWSWLPSRTGLEWFLTHVMPILRKREGCPTVILAGSGLSERDVQWAEELGVEVLGYVDDIDQFYRQVDIVVGPYFSGAGVRVKILEAMLYEKLVIGTQLAFRGLPLVRESSAIVCDSASDFVERIQALSRNKERAMAIARTGYLMAREVHDEAKVSDMLRARIRQEFRED